MNPQRTTLSVPGHLAKMHAKALASKADVIMLDLEDSVPADQKEAAREQVVKSLGTLDVSQRHVLVRINSVDTPFAFRDILALGALEGIAGLVIPKVAHERDIYFIRGLLDGLHMEGGRGTMDLQACIETPEGLERVSRIVEAGEGVLTALAFGIADYSAAVGSGLPSLSGHGENEGELYPGHRWHFPLSRMVMVAKAHGLLALDAPFGNFKNFEGLKKSALWGAALGCDGKWVIHPDQIGTVNEIFTPSKEEISRARTILKVADSAMNQGRGAVAVEGKMVDQATIRMAQRIRQTAEHLGLEF